MNLRIHGRLLFICVILALWSLPSLAEIKASSSSLYIQDSSKLGLHGQSAFTNKKKSLSIGFLEKRVDLGFDEKLWTFLIEARPNLAFFSERIELQFARKWSRNDTHHYRYNVLVDNIQVQSASVTAHYSKNDLRAISIAMTDFKRIVNYPHEVVELKLAEEADGKKARFIVVDDELRVALNYLAHDQHDFYQEIWEDALTGEVIERRVAGFDLISARVQIENDRDSETEIVELPNLDNDLFLQGKYFSVDTENEVGRVEADNGQMDFQPFDRGRFDQVAAYYNLSLGLDWFFNAFDYNYNHEGPIEVVVDSALDGNPNNARYVPAVGLNDKAMLVFGSGTWGKFEHLARDRDVAMHELSHHIIYRYIDDARSYAGSLHEGFADYFTYAMTGDPFLAEQVVNDAPYLRSAKIAQDKTFDNPYLQRNPHNLGQVWSAFLWESRENIGESFDEVVFHSLQYLNAGSNFGSANEALMLADKDLNPSFSASETDQLITGPNKCEIMNAAVSRGYATFLRHLDGEPCGIDIQAIAEESDSKKASDYDDGPLLFQACGQVGDHNSPFSLLYFIIALLIPLTLPLFFRRESRR